ncbi:HERV-H LTR-associating protein 1 [Eucyclogobius newberryi]|uniref:HERV-H LTR-associating protein 1 n=1 Tax=Eucyclogobius newberryi TaxID=166745 RepID=UPI003B597176
MALHKLTLLVYNISNIKNIESTMFRRRFCYCVTNETNDLTDFTAILLDVMGNSSSYLQELFKSSSILSISQRNNSDCIYICVMAGQLGREPLELWALDSITPLFNQTIVEGPHIVRNMSAARPVPVPVGEWTPEWVNRSLMSPSVNRVHSTAHVFPSSQTPEYDDHPAKTAVIHPTTQLSLTPIPTTPPKHSTTPGHMSTTVHHQPPTTEVSRPVTTRSLPVPTAHLSPASLSTPIPFPLRVTYSVPSPTTVSPELFKLTLSPTSMISSPQFSVPSRDTPAVALVHVFPTTQSPQTQGTTMDQSLVTTSRTVSTHSERTTTIPRRSATPSRLITTEQPGCPWRRPELELSTVKISAHKLQPCVFELCKFYSQCLCRSLRAKRTKKRYCSDSHLWYQKHTVEVCRRTRRLSFSRNLKQRCLSKICNKL